MQQDKGFSFGAEGKCATLFANDLDVAANSFYAQISSQRATDTAEDPLRTMPPGLMSCSTTVSGNCIFASGYNIKVNYNILATDYDSYLVTYICTGLF